LDIRQLGLPASTFITVAASYSADPPGTHRGHAHTSEFANPTRLLPAPTMTLSKSGANFLLSWATNAGILTIQSTAQLPGTWANLSPQPPLTVVGTNYQATIPASGAISFIRLVR